ncbi:hypothetical protein [Parasphingorhabdus sp.]|uniref:hypothetical protein n=1 Tax=Parasphingorhabdus sp. TaxID=2709688 RepID=UPI003A916772
MDEKLYYAGLSHVTYDGQPFDLGHGITLRTTYAHLFSTQMMAFERAEQGKAHPAPWRAARGGFQFDIEAEIGIPRNLEIPSKQKPEEIIWLIAALLRLIKYPYLAVPVISNHAFISAKEIDDPVLTPFEQDPRILMAPGGQPVAINPEHLEWVKSVWPKTAMLSKQNKSFGSALRAADGCTLSNPQAPMLLTAWGALEELFSPSRTELKFRTSANISAYLEPIGPKRLELFKGIAKLYDVRSKAAHTARSTDPGDLVSSYIILRNCLVKMIDNGTIPTNSDFEELIFAGSSHEDQSNP